MADLSASLTMGVTMTATATIRHNLAVQQLFAAARFTTMLGKIEAAHAKDDLGDFWDEMLHYALGVAMTSVGCLESYANELLCDGVVETAINPVAAKLLAEMIDKAAILEKYQTILALKEGKKLDLGANKVQTVQALIDLRNAVVHFRPEWSDQRVEHERLSRKLKHRFKCSPYFPNEGLFPRAWVTHDFGIRAIKSVAAFLRHFASEANLDDPLLPFEERLCQLSDGVLRVKK